MSSSWRVRTVRALGFATIAAASLVGIPSGSGGTPAMPPVHVAIGGSDSSCTRGLGAPPCATFNRAYAVAQGGDVVEVAAGAYPDQSIHADGTKSGPVTIRPAPNAVVTVAGLSIAASHLHIQGIVASGTGEGRGGLEVCDRECVPGLEDVVIKNFRGKYAFIRASNVTIRGGEFGGFDACRTANPEDAFRLWGGRVVPQPSNDVVVGVRIHDVGSGAGNTCQGTAHAGYHVDCVQTQGGVNITFRDNVFYNCATSNIQSEPFGGAQERTWLVENNFLGPTACCNSIVLTQASRGGNCSSFVVRYNVMDQPPNDVNCAGGRLQLYGNIFTRNVSSCSDNSDEAYNVYPRHNTATCRGPGNRKCNPAFVDPRATPPNYRLLPRDRCARGAGDPKRFPRFDLDGRVRLQGTIPDAGAYELRAVPSKLNKQKP